jgi:two-component system cell cycle sensor histidine kinase PleC
MTGLLILTFIPAAAAVLFWLRVREQRRVIQALMRELAASGTNGEQAQHRRATLLGTVAHELRSPIAAILGYEELMSEGVFGPLDPRAAEALARIHSSARQLLTLTDGMQELAQESPTNDVEWEHTDFAAALGAALERAAGEAEARRVQLIRTDDETELTGESERRTLEAILDAACGAALKTSAERTVRASIVADDGAVHYRFDDTGLNPEQIEHEPFASGAGLRVAIARRLAARIGGTVALRQADGNTTIDITIPRGAPPPRD